MGLLRDRTYPFNSINNANKRASSSQNVTPVLPNKEVQKQIKEFVKVASEKVYYWF